MKKIDNFEMKEISGGWYFGKVICPICGRQGKPTAIQRMFYSKKVLQNFLISAHGLYQAYGTKIRH